MSLPTNPTNCPLNLLITTVNNIQEESEKGRSYEEKHEDKLTEEQQEEKEIAEVHTHDVLLGRGGGGIRHIGNRNWSRLVASLKHYYYITPYRQILSKSIVRAVRSQDPPGRFLKQQHPDSNVWYDVGDSRALQITSQALKEEARNNHPSRLEDRFDDHIKKPNNHDKKEGRNKSILQGFSIDTSQALKEEARNIHPPRLEDRFDDDCINKPNNHDKKYGRNMFIRQGSHSDMSMDPLLFASVGSIDTKKDGRNLYRRQGSDSDVTMGTFLLASLSSIDTKEDGRNPFSRQVSLDSIGTFSIASFPLSIPNGSVESDMSCFTGSGGSVSVTSDEQREHRMRV
mmetsp:Transcript_17889/g.27109  ORF Transcript_17889/g.27109 Transcript_17889/m.27109 type:complete len:342 (+) Transcript_17889:55-1080(+)